MLTTTAFGFGCSARPSRVFGRLTSMPVCKMGEVTMKMTSSTSITSTRGVTLISASDDCVRPRWSVNAIRVIYFVKYREQCSTVKYSLLDISFDVMFLDKVEQLPRKTIKGRRDCFDLVQKVIVKDRRR